MSSPREYSLSHVSYYYSENGMSVCGLQDVSLDLSIGEFLVVTGPSGSGKSTLLKLLSLKELPDEGTLFFRGQDVSSLPQEEISKIRRENIAFVSENQPPIPYLTVKDNILYAMSARSLDTQESSSLVQDILYRTGLAGMEKQKAKSLSGGERIRLSLAQALASSAPILLLDEITSHLDADNGNKVLDILKEAQKDHLIVSVSHDFSLYKEIATKNIVLDNKRVVSDNKMKDLEETTLSIHQPETSLHSMPKRFSILPLPRFFFFVMLFLFLFVGFLGGGVLSSYQLKIMERTGVLKEESRIRYVFDNNQSGIANPYTLLLLGEEEDFGKDAVEDDGLLSFFLPISFCFTQEASFINHTIAVDYLPFLPADVDLSFQDDSEGFYLLLNSSLPDISYYEREEENLRRGIGQNHWLTYFQTNFTSPSFATYLSSLPMLGYAMADLGMMSRGAVVFTSSAKTILREKFLDDLQSFNIWVKIPNTFDLSLTNTFFENSLDVKLVDEDEIAFSIIGGIGSKSPILLPASYYERRASLEIKAFGKSLSLEEFLRKANALYGCLDLDMDISPGEESSLFSEEINKPLLFPNNGFLSLLFFQAFDVLHIYYFQDNDLRKECYENLLAEDRLVYLGDTSYSTNPRPAYEEDESQLNNSLDSPLKRRVYEEGAYESAIFLFALTLLGSLILLSILVFFLLFLGQRILKKNRADLEAMDFIGTEEKTRTHTLKEILLFPALLSFLLATGTFLLLLLSPAFLSLLSPIIFVLFFLLAILAAFLLSPLVLIRKEKEAEK